MKTATLLIATTMVLWLAAPPTQAQVRPDISSFIGGPGGQREQLYDLMVQYIDADVLQEHCNMIMTTGGMIHSDWDFLPFHRTYLEGMEDFLIAQGHPEFVPLPKWDPNTHAPAEFEFGGVNHDGVDPDCTGFPCTNGGPPAACSVAMNWDPHNARPAYLQLPTLCDHPMLPTFPDPGTNMNGNCCSTGLSRKIESPYHDDTHILMRATGGVMGYFRSPAAPIFWIWHAYVDDIWKEWEANCPTVALPPVDLYMKDTPKVVESERDRGEEPNIDTDPMWLSEDIWIHNQENDGGADQEHQNPDHHTTGGTNFVYVRVRNRGYEASAPGVPLRLYWAKAATALSWPSFWNGSITDPALMGEEIQSGHLLPSIPAGGSYIEVFEWNAPDPLIYAAVGSDPIFWANEPWHFCLLARIETETSAPFGMTFPETADLNGNVNRNNNIIWKNVSVIDIAGMAGGGGGWADDKLVGASVLTGDAWGQGGRFNLVFKNPDHYKGNPVTAEAEVRITLDQPLWEAWQASGGQMENMSISREERHQLIVTGSPAKLRNIYYPPGKRWLAHVSFNFLAKQLSGQPLFDFDFIQTDEAEKAVGGERYHVIVPGKEGFYADAGPDKNVSPNTAVNLSAYTVGEAAIYNWYDPHGELIYSGKT